MDVLACAPSSDGLDWQRVLVSKVIPSISVMRGYEALHAAAVESPDGVVAIMAPSGTGKSTLAAELLRRGWPLFADDVLVLDGQAGAVVAHPGTAHMNVAQEMPGALEPEMLGQEIAVLAGERWMKANALARSPRQVALLCLLERGPGLELSAELLPARPLLLAPYILGLSTDPERQRERFELYADLMESCTLMRLTAGPGDGPARDGRPDRAGALGPQARGEEHRVSARPLDLGQVQAPAAVAADAVTAAAPLMLQGVSKRWRKDLPLVLDDLSLTLEPGTSTWVGGRNGVGKTTMLRVAAGLIEPDTGRAEVWGVTHRENRTRYQQLVSFLPAGDRGLYARLTVRRQLEFCARISLIAREKVKDTVERSLAQFDLLELADRRVDRMSMGQRQRLRIAMTFLPDPEVVLLDEPLTSLDAEGSVLLQGALSQVLGRDGTVLWCSPSGEHVDMSFDAHWLIEGGRLVPA